MLCWFLLYNANQPYVHAKSLQLCPALFNPVDCRPPGSSVLGILQARILEWDPIPSSRGSSQSRDWTQVPYISSIASKFSSTSATWEARESTYFTINLFAYWFRVGDQHLGFSCFWMAKKKKKNPQKKLFSRQWRCCSCFQLGKLKYILLSKLFIEVKPT